MNKITVKPNSNFNSIGGNVIPDNASETYYEYRRCWMDNPKQFILRNMPLHLDIEASSLCNLRCTFCDRQPNVKSEQYGNLDFELFKHIIDQFDEDKLWGLKLSYRGEPLINKMIPKMIEYAKKKGVLDIYFNTNGMFLDEEMCKKLVKAKLDRISISIDGIDKEGYEAVRVGANYDILLDNIKTLRRVRDEFCVTYPKIRIQTVKLPEIDENKYKEKWEQYADEVAMIEYTDNSNREVGLKVKWACPQLWQRLTIEWNGDVFGCNNDDIKGIYIGNAANKSIFDCWHDINLMRIRELHKNGKSHEINACDGCPWRTAQIRRERLL